MKKIALALAISSTFLGLAFAGPEPISSKEIVPQPAPPPPCFNGWYFGVHGAATFEEGDIDTFSQGELGEEESSFFPGETRATGDHTRGGFGGFHLGRNFQFGALVLGIEADISLGVMEKDGDRPIRARVDLVETEDDDAFARIVTTSQTQLNWYSTVRPRLGYVFWNDRLMAFVTGGLAVGQADAEVHTEVSFDIDTDTIPVSGSESLHRFNDDVRVGWTVGGGLEFCLGHNWILNLTYLYMDLGDKDLRTRIFGPVSANDGEDSLEFARGAATSDLHYHILQGGLSYRF